MNLRYVKCMILFCVAEWFTLALPCSAAATCAHLRVKASVVINRSELTLADLLEADTCDRYRQAAAGVSLGPTPLAASVRVLDGGKVRSRIEALVAAGGISDKTVEEVPTRIVVRRAGGTKSCAEIAGFALRSLLPEHGARISQESFDCAAAWSVPENALLEITKTTWNVALGRWEFSMRCTRARDCVPFLVWARENHRKSSGNANASTPALSSLSLSSVASSAERLIQPGQTAILRWEEGGILVVLPVTCLEGGSLGQTVRVQFKNTRRILRAEIMSDGTLQAGL